MDKRSLDIYKYICTNPNINYVDISIKNNISNMQVKYSINKINSWLQSINIPPISDSENNIVVKDQHFNLLNNLEQSINSYIYSPDERVILVCFILLMQKEDISLIHLTSSLDVSRNTLLMDLKKAENILSDFEVTISYSRIYGYNLEGSEWNKRILLIYLLKEIYNSFGWGEWIKNYGNLNEQTLNEMKILIDQCEKELSLEFTDINKKLLPYIFSCLVERIRRNNELNEQIEGLSSEIIYVKLKK